MLVFGCGVCSSINRSKPVRKARNVKAETLANLSQVSAGFRRGNCFNSVQSATSRTFFLSVVKFRNLRILLECKVNIALHCAFYPEMFLNI